MSGYMNAAEARKIAYDNLKGPVIKPFMEAILARIEQDAKAGQTELAHPFYGMANFPKEPEREAVCIELARLGYKVVHHPDPDPGHPASGPYTTVSWA